jgi:ribosomal protein L37E
MEKPVTAIIYKREITFVDNYDYRIPTVAEVFRNKTSFEARLKELRNTLYRHVDKFLSCKNGYYIIIHSRTFIELSRNVASFLTGEEQEQLSKASITHGMWKMFSNYNPNRLIRGIDLRDIVSEVISTTGWKSESRIMGEVAELYFEKYISCQRCGALDYMKCPINEKSIDFVCRRCGTNYQIKCKKASSGFIRKLKSTRSIQMAGAEYSTTLKNVDKKIDYMILLYDNNHMLEDIVYIKYETIGEECVKPRNPLKATRMQFIIFRRYVSRCSLHSMK